MSTKYKHSHEVPTAVLAQRLVELSDAVGKRGEERDRELTRRVPAELDRDADLVLSEAATRLTALAAHVERLFEAFNRIAIENDSGTYSPQELEEALIKVFSDGPDTSRVRRDAEQQAEALEEALDRMVTQFGPIDWCDTEDAREAVELAIAALAKAREVKP